MAVVVVLASPSPHGCQSWAPVHFSLFFLFLWGFPAVLSPLSGLLVMFLFLSLEYSLSCATLPLLIQCHTEEAYNWENLNDVWDLGASQESLLISGF
jgi:hypothetical protein